MALSLGMNIGIVYFIWLGIFNFMVVSQFWAFANDYPLNNPVRQALFLPTSREVKYKAKAAIDTFFARTGDALQAVVVFAGTQLACAIPAFGAAKRR